MISVCLTTYNSERFLAPQLESILAQLSEGDEVIVSDDGSTDGTRQLVETLSRNTPVRLRWVDNPGPHGYTPNFANALSHAQGDYILLSDHDDVWLPGKVEACLAALQTAAVVTHDATIVDTDLKPIARYSETRKAHVGLWGNLLKFGHLGCCMAFRKATLSRALPFPPDPIRCTHDNWLYLVAATLGPTAHLPQPLILYRRHGSNASAGGQGHTSFFFKLNYRLYLVRHLLRRYLFPKSQRP